MSTEEREDLKAFFKIEISALDTKFDQQFLHLETKIDQLSHSVDVRFALMDQRFELLEDRLTRRIDDLGEAIGDTLARYQGFVEEKLEEHDRHIARLGYRLPEGS